jgi:hydrogenase-4 component F
MVAVLLLALLVAPFVAAVGCVVLRAARACEVLNLCASATSFACALPLPFVVDGRARLYWSDYVICDRISAWVILCTAIVYLLSSIYAVGYMRMLNEDHRLSSVTPCSPGSA